MTVTAQDVTLSLDASGAATLSAYDVVTDINVVGADEADIMNPANGWITLSQSTFTCADIGENITTIFVQRNGSAAPETFTFKVTVRDDILPTITCGDETFTYVSITNASCSITISDDAMNSVNAADNTSCATLTNNWNYASSLAGATFTIGTHTVIWTITDAAGNSASCPMPLTVLDRYAPDIVCRDTLLALGAAGTVSIKAEDLLESAVDCSPLTYVFNTGRDEITYGCGETGTYPLTVKVTDARANTSTCNATVTVSDTTRPALTVNALLTVRAGDTAPFAQVIVTLSDNCTPEADMRSPVNNLIRFDPSTSFACTDVGTSPTRTVYVRDAAGNETSATFTVFVEAMSPAYTPLKDTTLYTCSADTLPANTGKITSADVTVCGNAPATVTYANVSNRGVDKTQAEYYNYDITRRWTVSAGADNDSITVQTIMVRDTTPPLIVTASSLTVYLGQDGKWTLNPGSGLLSVSDCAASEDVSITYSVQEFNCSHTGTPQTITITGRDPSGNMSASTITVAVQDTLPPAVTPVNGITLTLDATGAATLTPQLAIENLHDNCTDSSDIKVAFSRDVFSTDDVGTQSVWIYVEDQWGNRDSVQLKITIAENAPRETNIAKRIQGRNVVNKGDTVTFILTVTNTFGGDLNLFIVDSLPAGLSFVEDKIPGNSSVDLTRKVITINHGFLAEGASVDYVITVRVEQAGTWTNYARLYRAGQRIGEAQATLTAQQPELTLTAKIREGDYTNTEISPAMYNVPDNYRLVVTLENKGGATVNQIDVRIIYSPSIHRFVSSSRGAEVTDNGGGVITWTVYDFEGSLREELELMFAPLIAATYTFVNEITTQLPFEDPSDNICLVTVNQAIVKVPNVLTPEHPELYIKDMDNAAITEATMKVFNTWGNQVSYISRRKEVIKETCWFDSSNLARATYWYELVIQYENGMSYVIRDYIEVLK
jgi:uncharacterized repeat protein (TIGR01451 family)